MKLNLRSIFTTPELLGLIKRVGSLLSKSQLRHSAQSREAESQNPAFMEIDSATAGMNALVQNDRSVNGLGWILDSQKMKISLRWNP